MSVVTPLEVLTVRGPVSAVVVDRMVRSRVLAADLRDAIRRLRHGEMGEWNEPERLDASAHRNGPALDLIDA